MPEAGNQYYVIPIETYAMLIDLGLGPYLTMFSSEPIDGYYYALASEDLDMELFDYLGDGTIGMMYYMYSCKWQTGL